MSILILLSAFAVNVQAQSVNNAKQPETEPERVQLSGEKIAQLFSNVRDEAIVRDKAGMTATNFWFADGRVISRWRNQDSSGEVTGSWRVKNDQRCVLITASTSGSVQPTEVCSRIFRQGREYISLNDDGSVHGIHQLTPIDLKNK